MTEAWNTTTRNETELPQLESPRYPDKTLTVHLVPHTHLRLGWLKTIDEYFLGVKTDDIL